MGLFREFVNDLHEVQLSGVAKVTARQQTPEERQALIEEDRERSRLAELDKPFELGGSL